MRITHTTNGGKPQTNVSLGRDGSKSITLPGHLSRAEARKIVGESGTHNRFALALERARA